MPGGKETGGANRLPSALLDRPRIAKREARDPEFENDRWYRLRPCRPAR